MKTATIQTVNDIGQRTLGQYFAGQQVMIDSRDWFNEPEHKKQFDKSMAWIASHSPCDAKTCAILKKMAIELDRM